MSGEAAGMRICPTCQGAMTVKGKDCHVCRGSGVLTASGGQVSYEDGIRFYDWYFEQQIHAKGRIFRT